MYFFESGLEAAQGKGIKELGIQKKLCKRGQAIVKKQEQIKGLMVTVLFSKSLDLDSKYIISTNNMSMADLTTFQGGNGM